MKNTSTCLKELDLLDLLEVEGDDLVLDTTHQQLVWPLGYLNKAVDAVYT